jgi:dienelactone hydrolase
MSLLQWKNIVIATLLIISLLWLLASLYLTSQATNLLFNIQTSWAPIPNFGYQQEYRRLPSGENISIWTIPNTSTEKVILYFHGNGGRINVQLPEMAKYATVVSPAYPGYHESESRPTPENVLTTADYMYEFLTDEKGIAPANIVVLGHSLGGSPATYFASKHPDIDRLIIINTFSSIQSMCFRSYSILCGFTNNIFNTAQYAQNVTVPVYHYIYQEDTTIPAQEGEALSNYFTKSSQYSKQYLDGYTHTYFNVANTLEGAGLQKSTLAETTFVEE